MANLDINDAIQYGLFARWAGNQFVGDLQSNGKYTTWGVIYNYAQGINRTNWINGFQGPEANAPSRLPAQVALDALQISNTKGIDVLYATDLRSPYEPITDGVNAKYLKGITLTKPNLSTPVDVVNSLSPPKINLEKDTKFQPVRIDATAPVGQQSSVTFTFTPGVQVSQTLTNEVGATISETITNGISNGTSHEWTYSTALRTGVEGKTKVPFVAEGSVKVEVENMWSNTWGSSQTIDYSKSEEKGSSTSKSTSTTITWAPEANADKLVYTNPTDPTKQVTLLAGQQYKFVLEVQEGKATTAASGSWDITANQPLVFKDSVGNQITRGAAQALKDALDWNYEGATGQPLNKNNITFNGTRATYTGNATLTTDYGYDAKVAIYKYESAKWLPLQSISETQVANSTSAQQTTYNFKDMLKTAQPNSGLDGIYFDDTLDEQLIKTSFVNVFGANKSVANVGNLNYTFSEFTNSQIYAGNGDNKIVNGLTENSNTIKLGNGNNAAYINGDLNTVIMGSGANVVILGGSGTNVVDVGTGPDTIKLNTLNSLTYVNHWDFKEDSLSFGTDIDPSKISFSFDEKTGAYTALAPDGRAVAFLFPDASTIPTIDTNTGRFSGEIIYSLPYANKDNAVFVTDVFAELVNRAPTKTEFTGLSSNLDKNITSRSEVIANVLKSAEFIKQFSDDTSLIQATYLDIFGRVADTQGLNYWKDAMSKGLTKEAFADHIIHSAEFTSLVGLSQTQALPI